MHDPLNILLRDTDASPEERARLLALMEADPDVRREVHQWITILESFSNRWEDELPDRTLLVLAALAEGDRADLLSQKERIEVEQAQPQLRFLRERFGSLPDVCASVRSDADLFDELWQDYGSTSRRDDRPAATRRGRRAPRWLWRVPVALTVMLFFALAILLTQRDAGLESVVTGPGQMEVVEFADGSSIRLMENSRLDYVPVERQSPINRRAVLEGNALFDITPQQLGFIVETPSASATVMGTLFGVVATEEQTDVTLVEGRVALTGADRPDAAIVLEPGQQSTVRRGAMPSTPQDVDVVAELAWTELFIFRSEPLTDIARQLADHFGVRIDVDPSLTGELITGTFDRGESVEAILRTLAAAVDARLEIRSGGFLLAP